MRIGSLARRNDESLCKYMKGGHRWHMKGGDLIFSLKMYLMQAYITTDILLIRIYSQITYCVRYEKMYFDIYLTIRVEHTLTFQ